MGKVEEAQKILEAIAVPASQHNEISALTLLALCDVKENSTWQQAQRKSLTVSKGIMTFIAEHYNRPYAPNTRETVRRQVLHYFNQAGITDYNPDNPNLPTNSPRTHYAISEDMLTVIKAYGTTSFDNKVGDFIDKHGTLIDKYAKSRSSNMIPVTLANGDTLKLSPGKHNEVQAAIINEFAPRFAPGSKTLYLGDTAKKVLIFESEYLNRLQVHLTDHSKLPDVILYDDNKNWLYLIEAVTSHGPMNPKRVMELDELFSKCSADIIYISAFPDFQEFRKHMNDISWETEVWLMDIPEHMIHFDGEKFLGPPQK